MPRRLLPASLVLALTPCMAQQVIYMEDFEGAQPAFTLNTPDMGSVTLGDNAWLVNAAYTGGNGTLTCLGFPFTFNVPNTPAQPVGITSANGNYMHISSAAAIASGILNCNFAAADGLCTDEASHFARMASDVNTSGASDVALSFWWLCAGGDNSYGELYYSINGGASWVLVPAPVAQYSGQGTWAQQVVSLPAFAGQDMLRFGFRFFNGTSSNPGDPAFGIDDVRIVVEQDTNSIATGAISPDAYCPGSVLSVPFTATGTWDAGNVFTAELSDASGSFAAPVAVGTLASTATGTIAATIPVATPLGSGYLIRVNGSGPATEGAASATAISIMAAPYAGQDVHILLCDSEGPQPLLGFMPGASTCGAWTGPGGGAAPDILDPATAASGAYTYMTNCPGGCLQDQAVLTLEVVVAPDAGDSAEVTLCANGAAVALITLLGGTPEVGGTWAGPAGPMNGVYVPGTTAPGCYTYTVAGTPPCASDQALVCVVEDPCLGVAEMNRAWAGLRWIGQQGPMQVIGFGERRPDRVDLFDSMGRRIEAGSHREGNELWINMADEAPGMYVVRLHAGDAVGTLRLVHGW